MLLEEFDKVNDLDHTHIVYLKHKKTGLNIVKKTVGIKQGVDEINILSKVNCDCFPRLLDFEINANHVSLYTLKVQGVRWDAVQHNQKFHQFVVENMEQVTKNAILVLKVLKNERLIHGDVKPDNLFIDEALNVKLIDFGSAISETAQGIKSNTMGVMHYSAPEVVLSNEGVSYLSDCYAMGKSILALIGSKKDYCNPDVLDKINSLCALRPQIRKDNFESFEVFTCK